MLYPQGKFGVWACVPVRCIGLCREDPILTWVMSVYEELSRYVSVCEYLCGDKCVWLCIWGCENVCMGWSVPGMYHSILDGLKVHMQPNEKLPYTPFHSPQRFQVYSGHLPLCQCSLGAGLSFHLMFEAVTCTGTLWKPYRCESVHQRVCEDHGVFCVRVCI